MLLGECARIWAAGHIGRVSRTRDDRVGPMIDSGPYGVVRNPLYVANLVIFFGFGVVLWPAAVFLTPILLLYYGAIVRWEESNLRARIGATYEAYQARVPRWLPRAFPRAGGWSGRVAFRSERGTFLVLGVVLVLVALRCYTLG